MCVCAYPIPTFLKRGKGNKVTGTKPCGKPASYLIPMQNMNLSWGKRHSIMGFDYLEARCTEHKEGIING